MNFFVIITLHALAIQTLLSSVNGSMEEKSEELSQLTRREEYCRLNENVNCGDCVCRDDPRLSAKYFCDCRRLSARRDCLEHLSTGGTASGLYIVHQNLGVRIQVYCDQQTDGGGWTVIQRRRDGTVNFYRDWKEYKNGFGELLNEFWLGNENIFTLSFSAVYPHGSELRIDMEDFKNNLYYEKYSRFQVENELLKYQLHVSSPSGTAGDGGFGMTYHSGMKFTTYDRDNDGDDGKNCAEEFKGGWWYNACGRALLNGYYYVNNEEKNMKTHGWRIWWFPVPEHRLKFVEMKMRRKQ